MPERSRWLVGSRAGVRREPGQGPYDRSRLRQPPEREAASARNLRTRPGRAFRPEDSRGQLGPPRSDPMAYSVTWRTVRPGRTAILALLTGGSACAWPRRRVRINAASQIPRSVICPNRSVRSGQCGRPPIRERHVLEERARAVRFSEALGVENGRQGPGFSFGNF